MPRGTKRASEDEPADSPSRVTKVSKTAQHIGPAKEKGAAKNGSQKPKIPAKPVPSLTDFKAKALPLHLNLTHTPPSITKEGDINDEGKEVGQTDTAADVGFIGNLTLVPSSFSTGSYGWKGSKRITVELQASDEEGEGGTKEKVVVMFTVNATVLGSKPAKSGKGKKGKKEEEEEEEPDVGEVEEPVEEES